MAEMTEMKRLLAIMESAEGSVPGGQAIALPYVIEQNEPSRPIPTIVNLPTEATARRQMILHLMNEHVTELADDELTIEDSDGRYGDVVASDRDGECFLYFTFLDG